jgi:signal transduction histidine kinase
VLQVGPVSEDEAQLDVDPVARASDEAQALQQRVESLEREIEVLTEAIAARDRFIATAGHELRNSMGSVLVGVSSLAAKAHAASLPSWSVERLDRLSLHARAFVRRATTLLDVARITTDNVRLEPELLDLSELVARCVSELAAEAERGGCDVSLALDREVMGFWDRAGVEQVTMNLVSNAIKYGAGSPVDVRLVADEHACELSVRDRGPGVTDDDRVRIFERFERAVRRADRAGFGLGLWISRQLVVAHRGEISVSSEIGSGSVFTVTLPRGITSHPR